MLIPPFFLLKITCVYNFTIILGRSQTKSKGTRLFETKKQGIQIKKMIKKIASMIKYE